MKGIKAMFVGWTNALKQQDGEVHGQAARSEPSRQMTNKGGFTLIELLVVVAIIALLMAILLPTLQRARKRAKATVCLSHLKEWGTTFALYVQDNEGRLPGDQGKEVWLLRGASTNQSGAGEPKVGRSIRTEGIACCPMATKLAENSGSIVVGGPDYQLKGTPGDVFSAWEIRSPGPAFRGSYGLNDSLFVPEAGSESWSANSKHPLETNVFSIHHAARVPMLLDSSSPMVWAGDEKTPPPRDGYRATVGMGAFCTKRHDEYVNGLFLDWSARKIGLKELWTLKWHPAWNTAGPWTKAGGVKPEQWPTHPW